MSERITLEILADRFDYHETHCLEQGKRTEQAIRDLSDKVQSLETIPQRLIKWLLPIISAAILGGWAQTWFLHSDTQAVIASRTADRYTATDASRDRATQATRDAAISAQIAASPKAP